MSDKGLSMVKAALSLGLSSSAASSRMKTAKRRVGIEGIEAEYPALRGVFRGSQVNKGSGEALAFRAKAQAQGRDITLIKPDQILDTSLDKLCLSLSYLDAHQLSTAKASELMSIIKGLFDISQVLQGKPTSISAGANLKALDALLPAVMREAARRGVTVDAKAVRVEETSKKRANPGPQVAARGSEEGGPEAHPPGGLGAGPIEPPEPSAFSKILNSF